MNPHIPDLSLRSQEDWEKHINIKKKDIAQLEKMIKELHMKLETLNQDLEELLINKRFYMEAGKNGKI